MSIVYVLTKKSMSMSIVYVLTKKSMSMSIVYVLTKKSMSIIYVLTKKSMSMSIVYVLTKKSMSMSIVYVLTKKSMSMSIVYVLTKKFMSMSIVYVLTKKYSVPPRRIYFNIILQDLECGPVPWKFPDLSFSLLILHLYHVRIWLRHCTTSQQAVGSIPDVFIGIFHSHNPSGHTVSLGSNQSLTEMSTRNISWR